MIIIIDFLLILSIFGERGNMELKLFAERLEELIFEKGKPTRFIAKEMGIGKTALYDYLSGKKMPTLLNLIKITDYFSCSTDFILGLENESYETSFLPFKGIDKSLPKVLAQFNLTRYKLEKLTGVSESTLYYWAKGQKLPSVEKIVAICEKLDCSVDFFLGRVI